MSKNQEKYREMKILPASIEQSSCFWILPNKVGLGDTQTPKAVLIENTSISSVLRQVFEQAWATT